MKKQTAYATGGVIALIIVLLLALSLDLLFPLESSGYTTPLGYEGPRSGVAAPETESQNVVLIEEFSDFQCPFCAQAVPIAKRVKAHYGDQIEFLYRHFPIEKIHPLAPRAALASECMRDQEMFWTYHDLLFENQARLSDSMIRELAAQAGAEMALFDACMSSMRHAVILQEDFLEGRERGVEGTPTFFVNGARYEGVVSYDRFVEIIDRELTRAESQYARDPQDVDRKEGTA